MNSNKFDIRLDAPKCLIVTVARPRQVVTAGQGAIQVVWGVGQDFRPPPSVRLQSMPQMREEVE